MKTLLILTALLVFNTAEAKQMNIRCNATISLEGESNVSSETKTAPIAEPGTPQETLHFSDANLIINAVPKMNNNTLDFIYLMIEDKVTGSHVYSGTEKNGYSSLTYRFSRRTNGNNELVNLLQVDCLVQ